MARPKHGEEGCEAANKKWRETMLKHYGSEEELHKAMQRIGRIGGRNGKGPDYKGGFAADREKARAAGKIGGTKSSRLGVRNGEGKVHQKEA